MRRETKSMHARRGHTLIEVTIAAALVTGIVIVASTTSGSISDASNYGRHLLEVQGNNQSALYFIANDLQNSSSDTDPLTNLPRYEIQDDNFVVELNPRTAISAASGARTDLVRAVTGTQISSFEDADAALATATNTPSTGEVFEGRPRELRVLKNSRFTFHKVTGHEIDAGIGAVQPLWSAPITYFVRRRHLIREQNGTERVIGRNVTAFKVFAETGANFEIFLRTQKRDPRTGDVLTVSGSIEVNPKNR